MKNKLTLKIAAALLALATVSSPLSSTFAQGTAFTYQGQLLVGGAPANGLYDVCFKLINPTCSCATVVKTNLGVTVQNGLFTTLVDLGPVFDGTPYSLQLAVRTTVVGGGSGPFTDLFPAIPVTPAPYALFASTLGGLAPTSFWQNGGNPGTPGGVNFLGTSTYQPLTLGVNGQAALQIVPTQGGAADLIGGSSSNVVVESAIGSTIGGGGSATIFGGCLSFANTIAANNAFIGSGSGNVINILADSSVIGGGDCNLIDTDSAEAFIGGGHQNVIKTTDNPAGSISSIAGGSGNSIGVNDLASTIGGGQNNQVGDNITEGTVAGGFANRVVSGNLTTIGGGYANRINSGNAATIAGGQGNKISSDYASAGGGNGNVIQASASASTISGGALNLIQTSGTTSFIGGGSNNTIQASVNISMPSETMGAVIGGGLHNTIQTDGAMAFIGGGVQNAIAEYSCVIGGGENNSIEAAASVIGGGELNDVEGSSSFIGGGENNTIYGSHSMVPGGYFNTVGGNNSFAAGYYANANNNGCFIWADSSGGLGIPFNSTTDYEFAARARGGVRFVTAVDGSGAPLAGVYVGAGGTSWGTICDRNAKKNFARVNTETVLEKLAKVPVQTWNYKWESDTSVPHIGPMAQDFKAAFYPGRDDKTITTLEFDGVELAALQGLNQKLNEKDEEIQMLKQKADKVDSLEKRLNELEHMVKSLAANK